MKKTLTRVKINKKNKQFTQKSLPEVDEMKVSESKKLTQHTPIVPEWAKCIPTLNKDMSECNGFRLADRVWRSGRFHLNFLNIMPPP